MAFIIGSATFTSGSKNVTGVTVSSGVLVNIASGTMLSVGENPVSATVEAISAPSETTITLRENWPLGTGTYNFTATFTPEGIRDGIQSLRDATTALDNATGSFGTAASKDVTTSSTDTTADRVLLVGASQSQLSAEAKEAIDGARDGKIGIAMQPEGSVDLDTVIYNGFKFLFAPTNGATSQTSTLISAMSDNNGGRGLQIQSRVNLSSIFFRVWDGGIPKAWYEFWTSSNTTVDGSGFIKEASPIVKLFSDNAEFNDQCPENAEFEKVDTGHYLIKNTQGFAQKGWYIENPKDANGNVKVYVDFEQLEDNTIEIKTYTPDYSTGKCMAGIPEDIPTDRWIDLRLEVEPVTIDETITEDV